MSGHDFGYQASQYAQFAGRVTDPGNGGEIVVEPDGSEKSLAIKTSGAETRTLKDPAHVGQTLLLYMDTDGGDCVITADTAINQSGNTVMTFDDTGDTVHLRSITVADAPVWRISSNSGVSLS